MQEKITANMAGRIAEQHVSLDDPTDWQFPYDKLKAKDILAYTESVIEHIDEQLCQILESDELTWESIVAPVSAISETLTQLVSPIYVMRHAHPSKKVRDAAREAELRINLYDISIWHRTELFEKIRSFSETEEAEGLSEEKARYLRLRMQQMNDKGHSLDPKDKARIRELEDRMSVRETAFAENITEHTSTITLGRGDLKGMPDWYIEDLKRDKKGRYVIEVNPASANMVISSAEDRSTREKINKAAGSVAGDTNEPILEEMRMMRHEAAQLLGHASWAHFQLEQCMLKTPEEVRALYQRLISALRPKAEEEVSVTAKMLRQDGYDDVVRSYDMTYYASKQLSEKVYIADEKIIEYFPLKHVLKELFEVDRELYGLKYKHMKGIPVWHKDVLVYGLHHETTDELRAILYLDLFEREGKNTSAFQIPMQAGRRLQDGAYRPAVGAIIADFVTSAKGTPPLLAVQEIHTLEHEKGHFLTLVSSEAEMTEFTFANDYFAGKDYVELPSQVKEKWAEDTEILYRLSRHYKTGKKLSRKKIERYLETQKINEASAKLARFALHLTDLDIHDVPDGRSVEEILRENAQIGLVPYDEGTFPLASDAHMIDYPGVTSGYDVSEVFAYDIFQKLKASGLSNRRTGKKFRNKMLRFGGSKDGLEMVRDILGREPNPNAYLKNLGVSE